MSQSYILVVDDEPGIRRLAELSLAHVGGLRVTLAATAAEGLKLGLLATAARPECNSASLERQFAGPGCWTRGSRGR